MAFAAALLLVPVAQAQTNPPYYVDTQSGYAYNKYLKSTTPDANGQYTVRIETFATGSVQNLSSSSDIVLVLDMSGSMRYDYYSGYPNAPETLASNSTAVFKEEGTYGTNKNVRYAQNRAFNAKFVPMQNENNIIFNTCLNWDQEGGTARYYKHSNGTYYLVHQEGPINGKYFLYYKVGSTKYYLWGTGTTTTRPAGRGKRNPDAASETDWLIYTGNLYRYKTRLEVLQSAVNSFIDVIAQNSTVLTQKGKDPNRISIVQLSGLSRVRTSVVTSDPGGDDHTYVRRTLTNLTTGNATNIKDNVTAMRCKGETPVDAAMRQARLHLQNSGMADHNKFVVVFTDGEPRQLSGDNVTPASTWDNLKAHVTRAINDANLIKRTTGMDGTIFTMGLGPTSTSKKFLQYLSSMYVDPVSVAGTNASPTYSGTRNSDTKTKFYQDDANSNFQAIFDHIAEHIHNDAESSVASVDLVSASFKLPAGVSASSVKVFTAPCTGKNGNYYTFGSEVQAPNRGNVTLWVNSTTSGGTVQWTKKTLDIDNLVTVQTDAVNDKVTVTGFDYATLWCGTDEIAQHVTDHGSIYRGYKLIFEFPIVLQEGVVGGPDVPTNLSDSGLYPLDDQGKIDMDNPIIIYPIPEVTIPVRLIIQKKGLAKGESASFTVERKPISGSGSWTFFTNLVITGNGTDTPVPEMRLLNLDPNYHYRIKETGWSWSYTKADGESYMPSTETVNPKLGNPIIFTNTPKTNVPKHAEAKSVNTMKATGSGQTTVYD